MYNNIGMTHISENIIAYYRRYGTHDYIGECGVSQIQHAAQAFLLALDCTYVDDHTKKCVAVAAFLHDLGHLIGIPNKLETMNDSDGSSLGISHHEKVASDYLRNIGLPELVCELVLSHVDAKRYLCSVNNDRVLSDASRKTLEKQGGIMSEEERHIFEKSFNFNLKLLIRNCDDMAKKNNYPLEKDINEILEIVKLYIEEIIIQ